MLNVSYFAARAAHYWDLELSKEDTWQADTFLGLSAMFQEMAILSADREEEDEEARQARTVAVPLARLAILDLVKGILALLFRSLQSWPLPRNAIPANKSSN